MSITNEERDERIAKYSEYLNKGITGGFTTKTRNRILGITEGLSGRDRTKNDFWQDARDHIRMGLIDLEIFIRYAPADQVKQVVTKESLDPIFTPLLWHPVAEGAKPDLRNARIAQLLIQRSFDYLSAMKPDQVTASHSRTMEEAIDLSNFLSESFKPESERHYIVNVP